MVKAASQAKGLCSLIADFGLKAEIAVHTDSTAAIGIVHRRGFGKTRHIEVQYLWIQENVTRKGISVSKICTTVNPADMLTKGLKRETIEEQLRFTSGQVQQGKSKTALSIHAVSSSSSSKSKMMKVMTANLLQRGGDR